MTKQLYIEKDCCIEHNGKSFCSNGAFVSPDYVIGYLAKDGILTNWHGDNLGTYRITRSWQRRSYISTFLHQVYATVNGVTYTGRSAGIGMIFKGRKVK